MELKAQLLGEGASDLDEVAGIAIYYRAMEALNGILKHSGASSVGITLPGDRTGSEFM